MKKIALINPASSFLKTDGDRPPLGLCYLASAVRENHDVRIFDFSVDLRHTLLQNIRKFEPEIIGFTATTPVFFEAFQLLKEIDIMAHWNFVSVIGGVHATVMPEFCLKYFDYVFTGESETAFSSFCDGIDNIGLNMPYLFNLMYPENTNINGLIPARDLLPMYKYEMKLDGEICTPIITSRGCPYGCVYCSNIHGKKVRLNSAKNVVKEIKSIIDNYGIKSFYFLDDVFTINKKRVYDICDLIKAEGLNITFRATTRIDLVDRAMLQALKGIGLKMVCYGLESGSDRVLGLYNKRFTTADIRRVVGLTRELGIRIKGFWMTSFLEDETDKQATKDLMQELGLENDDVYNLTVYPGSKLWKDKYGDRQDFELDDFKNLYHGGK